MHYSKIEYKEIENNKNGIDEEIIDEACWNIGCKEKEMDNPEDQRFNNIQGYQINKNENQRRLNTT